MQKFSIIVYTLAGPAEPSIAIAASKANATGVLNLEYTDDVQTARDAINKLALHAKTDFAIKLNTSATDFSIRVLKDKPDRLSTVILTACDLVLLREHVGKLHNDGIIVLLESINLQQARMGIEAGVDGLIAKGHESGGRIGEESTFVLVQQLLAEKNLPVFAHGGIGLHTAAACYAAGAAGIVLDSQLLLCKESPCPESVKSIIGHMEGNETQCIGEEFGEIYRVYLRPRTKIAEDIKGAEYVLSHNNRTIVDITESWRQLIKKYVGWDSIEDKILFVGQDVCLAAPFAKRFGTVGKVIEGIRESVQSHCHDAVKLRSIDIDSPLAQSHGTRYPIVQGPMARISDMPSFSLAIAENGGLPFLALSLMEPSELKKLLTETKNILKDNPWGVGIIGFIPPEILKKQIEVICECKPPYALIAGGKPHQSKPLIEVGIPTYLHVPTPILLKMFLHSGDTRFIFEGRESGGHVAPLCSFVLWDIMIDELLRFLTPEKDASKYHVLFAGGIHDALSAFMVTVLASPLARRGVRIGLQMGSAYLFTEEIVRLGGIVEKYQKQAIDCDKTVVLNVGPGHENRCVLTSFTKSFENEKRSLKKQNKSSEEIRFELEQICIGRLLMASKGLSIEFELESSVQKYISLSENEQQEKGMYLIGQIAAMHNTTTTISALHNDIAIEGSRMLEELLARDMEPHFKRQIEQPSDIAIIGMACIMPKAPDLVTYWENILNKVNTVTEIPKERWDWHLYYDKNPKAQDKVYSKWGAFLDYVEFDPIEYGMPPNSLTSVEPMQLLTLKTAKEALKNAGYYDRDFNRQRTSVILGSGGGAGDLGQKYCLRSSLPMIFGNVAADILSNIDGDMPEWTEDSFPGILMNVNAGRIANRFNLGGMNIVVDAACASSLAAVHLAVKELESGTSDMVIVGGADTMQNPFAFTCFSKTMALSPTGEARTFDETADGIVLGEGIGVIILKRLADAERDGDKIYAVIKGVGFSSDGKAKGLTAPSPEGQILALKRAYTKANVSPATVALFEAHGTGTVVGDNTELEALVRLLIESGSTGQSSAVGSVKSMIGHTKNTAGIASLIKSTLSLYHKVIPPTLGVSTPNKAVNYPESPLYINTEARPWISNILSNPRRSGVSAFGFGGTNFHAVLEEYRDNYIKNENEFESPIMEWPCELFIISGDSRQDIIHRMEIISKRLSRRDKIRLRDLAYTLSRLNEQKYGHRTVDQQGEHLCCTIIATSLDDLEKKLLWAKEALSSLNKEVADIALEISDPRGIYFSENPLWLLGKIAFLFPGQGSQYTNMLKDLAIHFDEVRSCFERADSSLHDRWSKLLSSYIFPPTSFSEDQKNAVEEALKKTDVAQPAVGAADMAIYHLLKIFGVHPDFVAGHSYGEYVAACVAGVYKEDDLIQMSEARGRFIMQAVGDDPGTMAAIQAGYNEVNEIIQGIDDIVIANLNAHQQTVISGGKSAIKTALESCEARGILARTFPIACAFHSPRVTKASEFLAQYLSKIEIHPPEIDLFSNTTANSYPYEPESIVSLLAKQVVSPVRFVEEIEAIFNAGARIFVEVGPKNVMTNLAKQILENKHCLIVASDNSNRHGLVQLQDLLAQLAAHGVDIKLERLYRGRDVRLLSLNDLEKDNIGVKPSSTTWLVNGGRAIPMAKAQQITNITKPLHITINSKEQTIEHESISKKSLKQVQQSLSKPEISAKSNISTKKPEKIVTSLNSLHHDTDGRDRVVLRFQEVMNRFLETQKQVMQMYLSSENNQQLPDDSTQPHVITTENQGTTTEKIPEQNIRDIKMPGTDKEYFDLSNKIQQASKVVVNKNELTAHLLQIVSDRTGYPKEMLNIDVDLEADLGIDSIKRIEILGSFREKYPAINGTNIDRMVAELAGIKTLKGIIDWMAYNLESTVETNVRHKSTQLAAGMDAVHESTQSVSVSNSKENIEEYLLQIISERTGYPTEMMGLDLDLEADLGIDSIKRIEILGSFREKYPTLNGKNMDRMMEEIAGLKTLNSIITWLASGTSVTPEKVENKVKIPSFEVKVSSTETEKITVKSNIKRFILKAVPTAPIEKSSSIIRESTFIISDDEGGVAQILSTELRHRGYNVVVIRMGTEINVQKADVTTYTGDLTNPSDVEKLIGLIREAHAPIGGYIHLLPLNQGTEFNEMNLVDWQERIKMDVKSLFYIAKELNIDLQNSAKRGGACLIASTKMGGSFASLYIAKEGLATMEDFFPGQAGITGLIKTVAVEWPGINTKTVDFSSNDSIQHIAEKLSEEIFSSDENAEVGYRNNERLALKTVNADIEDHKPSNIVIDSSTVILLTGGAQGITADIAIELARRYKPTLLLLGRTPFPKVEECSETLGLEQQSLKVSLIQKMKRENKDVTLAEVEKAYRRLLKEREIRKNIKYIYDMGATVEYFQVDVRDEKQFGELIDQIYAKYGKIDGVIHGAGVIEDKLIKDKTPESFNRVFDTKVDSAFILSRKLRSNSTKFLVFFASVAGRFGNPGQSDYAAANEIYCKLANYIDNYWPGRVVSIIWGPWSRKGGMVSQELEKQFSKLGIQMIPSEIGVSRFVEELLYGKKGETEVILGGTLDEGMGAQRLGITSVIKEERPDSGKTLLPLFNSVTSISKIPQQSIEVIREINITNDHYLNDHRLDNLPVFPMAMALELMAETVYHNWPNMEIGSIYNFQILKGIVLNNDSKLLRVTAESTAKSCSDNVNVEVTITGVDKKGLINYKATMDLVKNLPASPIMNTASIDGLNPFTHSVENTYRQWLFHGPYFQGITLIDGIGENGIQGSLSTSLPQRGLLDAGQGQWLIDPIIIDSSLQLTLIWARLHWGMTGLPTRFSVFRRFGSFKKRVINCKIKMRSNNRIPVMHTDIAFLSNDGCLLGIIEDMEGMCSTSLNRLAGGHLEIKGKGN